MINKPTVGIFAGSASQQLTLALGKADVGKFSDGETTVELNENVRGKDVFVLQSTCAPTNDNLMELVCHGGLPASGIRRKNYSRHSLLRLCPSGPKGSICKSANYREG